MLDLLKDCVIQSATPELSFQDFDCGNCDLNDFFQNDVINYRQKLLGKTYVFLLKKNPKKIVCAFTVSNDSIRSFDLPNARKKKLNEDIPRAKRFRSYPAVLIGRLGVDKVFNKQGLGSQLLTFIKLMFIHPDNKTGCRFVSVDAYNNNEALSYYKKNGFKFLFSSEEQEKGYYKIDGSAELTSRLLYFDLITLRIE